MLNTSIFKNTNINLVSVKNGQVVTSSLQVANHFGKNHKDVLKSIKLLDCSLNFTERNFAPSTYKDTSGKKNPLYYMTRDGFTFLAMGFTGKIAAKFKEDYIAAFNAMESALKEKSFHPGRMIPTECIVLTCTDQSGKEKQAYLYYGDDSWFDMSRLDGDRELIMKYMMAHIAERDKEVVKYDRHCYLFRNGKWEPSGLMSRTVDKITVNSDPVGYCKLAIKDYEEAKVKMKKAAKVVADM